jgi:hypothetical protein
MAIEKEQINFPSAKLRDFPAEEVSLEEKWSAEERKKTFID